MLRKLKVLLSRLVYEYLSNHNSSVCAKLNNYYKTRSCTTNTITLLISPSIASHKAVCKGVIVTFILICLAFLCQMFTLRFLRPRTSTGSSI